MNNSKKCAWLDMMCGLRLLFTAKWKLGRIYETASATPIYLSGIIRYQYLVEITAMETIFT